MALPNYTPSGRILFGSVPWDNGYTNVRLYTSTGSQYSDIASMMTISSNNYTYIGRNRRLKVSIEADRLYHCNYCMYENASLTNGYIYCFITDVQYVNDHTTELQLETDVFNTYLYGVDWTIPACFIERETVPSESSNYLLTNEPDFPLIYTVNTETHDWFVSGGVVVMSSAYPEKNDNIVDEILNPGGFVARPAPVSIQHGIFEGANFAYFATPNHVSERVEQFVNELTNAGSNDSIVAIFTIPSFAADQIRNQEKKNGMAVTGSDQDGPYTYQNSFAAPVQGTTVDGYTPRNKKLLNYPYNFCRLTDYAGSSSDLRYELMGSTEINIKYALSPACQAIVVPRNYMGITNFDVGMTVSCGALGSWANNTYESWIAQNGGIIALTIAGAAVAGVAGATTIANAASTLEMASEISTLPVKGAAAAADAAAAKGVAMQARGMAAVGAAGSTGLNGIQSLYQGSRQPTVTRGQSNINISFATGAQGVHAQRISVKAEIAQQIDQFFDRWGYEVDRIENVNITSRPAWNYVKTGGAAPKSLNGAAGTAAPFSRGRGTPAAALSIIRKAFDGGVTFWHSTANFGDYSQANGVS